MANYTTADVKRLRELTAAGMMDCKKALDETDGDFDKAVEILRIKGAKDVGKRAERTTANGLVASVTNGTSGVLVELKCETDFVAKGERFQALGATLVAAFAAMSARSAGGRSGAFLFLGALLVFFLVAFGANAADHAGFLRAQRVNILGCVRTGNAGTRSALRAEASAAIRARRSAAGR